MGGVGGEREERYRGGVVYISAQDFQTSGSVSNRPKKQNKKKEKERLQKKR